MSKEIRTVNNAETLSRDLAFSHAIRRGLEAEVVALRKNLAEEVVISNRRGQQIVRWKSRRRFGTCENCYYANWRAPEADGWASCRWCLHITPDFYCKRWTERWSEEMKDRD